MAYAKVSLLPLFLLATLVIIFSMKKVEAGDFLMKKVEAGDFLMEKVDAVDFLMEMKGTESCEDLYCTLFGKKCDVRCDRCKCVYSGSTYSPRIYCVKNSDVRKIVEQTPNLCETHVDCIKKESGSFCAFIPNSNIEHGMCFDSNSQAQARIKNILFSEFSNLLKMSSAI
ncbi:unnamed protein product [Vicia faba]|uniref:Albumin I chain a domain-containing protein n=1 Tax=Vicia faba TaxID=3906 RepID=A0AAV0ZQL4_VICFA|nr:unnamed protein product [Vicia faba]